MDADIARAYADAGITGLKPSMVMELLRLHARGPMTITELAESVQRTHSATSQKVAAMRAAGPGPHDHRRRRPHQEDHADRQGQADHRQAGRRMARHRGRDSRPGSGDPLPAHQGRDRHRGRPAPQELPRPDRRKARRRPGLGVTVGGPGTEARSALNSLLLVNGRPAVRTRSPAPSSERVQTLITPPTRGTNDTSQIYPAGPPRGYIEQLPSGSFRVSVYARTAEFGSAAPVYRVLLLEIRACPLALLRAPGRAWRSF